MGDVHVKFDSLRRYLELHSPITKQRNSFRLTNIEFVTGNFFPFHFSEGGKEEYTLIRSRDPQDYEEIDVLVDYFQERPRMMARRSDAAFCPMDYWLKHGSGIVEELFKSRKDFNTLNLRELLYRKARECTQFKPSLAFTVFKLLKATRILDFSAGWGDRLAAAIAADVESYVGVDPNLDLKKGHSDIIEAFARPEERDRYRVIYSPFQTADLGGARFDLVFTSPPFFDFEIYSTIEGQSILDHPDMTSWLIHFLFVSLKKAWDHLNVISS
eukprot:TRINITY_DN5297_c0_g1_i1.p1 TRINITY_DN5297_c0_g1~~TRINITY_DN5297_c0_g1_i1.p1  ORF type:complete len:271 (+),score=35.71 TRINITY_DN5297_c0_g1_i1:719-1531(+)